MYRNSNL